MRGVKWDQALLTGMWQAARARVGLVSERKFECTAPTSDLDAHPNFWTRPSVKARPRAHGSACPHMMRRGMLHAVRRLPPSALLIPTAAWYHHNAYDAASAAARLP